MRDVFVDGKAHFSIIASNEYAGDDAWTYYITDIKNGKAMTEEEAAAIEALRAAEKLAVAKEEATKIWKEKGFTFVEDAGRGYRRVVPSPKPINIIELEIIKRLKSRNVVIAIGGGGIPVVRTRKGFQGVDAVIDKDLSSAKLATQLNADILLILTAVEKVYITIENW